MNEASRRTAEGLAERGAAMYWGARVAGFLALFQFVGLTGAAALWWWAMPQGFPATHPRFAMNLLVPPVFLALGGIAVYAGLLSRPGLLRGCQLFVLGFTLAAGLTGLALFPESMLGLRLLSVAGCVVIGVAVVSTLVFWFIPQAPVSHWILLPAVALGVFVPWSQRGAEPSTLPGNHALPGSEYNERPGRRTTISLSEHFDVQPFGATVLAKRGKLILHVEPVLTFVSTSPPRDRFWTLFSPTSPSPVRLTGYQHDHGNFAANYFSDFPSHLQVAATNEILRLTALSELSQPVYSHLNSYANFHLYGDQPISVLFSPSPARIAVLPSDYPAGRPARFACLKPDGRFEVVEASSGEKGPFKILTAGALSRGEPLEIILIDGDQKAFEIVLEDWSAQASTQLSPTAGWGQPQNAIEFSLSDAGNAAMFSVTLAGTSVGRGWDSVGHAAGGYRNRMSIRVIP